MQITVRSTALSEAKVDLLAIPLRKVDGKTRRLPSKVAAFDRAHGRAIEALIDSGDFDGSAGQSALLYPTGKSGKKSTTGPARVLLLGLGDGEELDAEKLRSSAGRAVKQALTKKAARFALLVPKLRGLRTAQTVQAVTEGVVLGSYRFDRYKTSKAGASKEKDLRSVLLVLEGDSDLRAAREAARVGQVLAECQNLARDLSNEPPNELPPIGLATAARKASREAGLKCKVLDVPAMKRLGMGAILAVGGGSVNPPRMIVMEHTPKKKTRRTPTLCIVGKGITMDTGGISIKPSAGMQEMKHDMSGAATVVGAMRAVGLLDLNVHVVGIIAAAENMPGGKAYRPGDVVPTMSGKTIEILNTDAEGRVVLADALHYAVQNYSPDAMVDLATLTGACVVALGGWATGLFSKDERLRDELVAAGDAVGELMWPMPLLDAHEKAMHSKVADLKNSGGRDAGASTAAGFLAAFVGDTAWAHLDIAGTGWDIKGGGHNVYGASGVAVRSLIHWLRVRGGAKV